MKPTIFLRILFFIPVLALINCKKESNKLPAPLPNPAIGELIPVANLSISRYGIAGAAAGSKIMIAGGYNASNPLTEYSRVDIYDTITRTWSIAELSEARANIAAVAVGNKILFAGGAKNYDYNTGSHETTSRVDIYDVATNSWSITEMPEGGHFESGAAVAAGNLAFFYPGGSSEIFVYNVVNNSWSTIQISESRIYPAAVSSQNQNVFFAGGYSAGGVFSKSVDVYSSSTNSWSVDSLSEGRSHLKATSVNSKTLFAGGMPSLAKPTTDKVDIYDNSSPAWTIGQLSMAIAPANAITTEEKAVFLSGSHAEIYNASLNTWSTAALYQGNLAASHYVEAGFTVVIPSGNKVFIAGTLTNSGYSPGVWITRF
jgi:Kelch motif